MPKLREDLQVADALRELGRRTQELMDLAKDVRDALEDETEERATEDRKLREHVDAEVARLEEQDRQVAVGGMCGWRRSACSSSRSGPSSRDLPPASP